jgi:hypothetical protein
VHAPVLTLVDVENITLASQPRRHIGRKRVAVASFDINNTRTKSCMRYGGCFDDAMRNRMIYYTATSPTRLSWTQPQGHTAMCRV